MATKMKGASMRRRVVKNPFANVYVVCKNWSFDR